MERVLERVAASMLSTQFIIEGTVVVCDAKGWDVDNVRNYISDRGRELLCVVGRL